MGLLFLVALAVRLLYVVELSSSPLGTYLLGDGIAYVAWAKRIAGGNWLGTEVFYQSPFYPYLLALLRANLTWTRVLQSLLGATSCVFVAMAGRRFFGDRQGLCAGLLLVLYPPAIFFDGEIQKASLDLFFMSLLLVLLARFRDDPRRELAALLGVVTGLFALNRENALLLVPLLAAWIAFLPHVAMRWRVQVAALLVAGAALVLLPVALRNRAIGGELLLTTSQLGPNFYIGNHAGANGRYLPLRAGRGSAQYEREDATQLAESASGRRLLPAEVSDYWLARGLRFVREEPRAWSALLARKLFLTWNRREIVDTTSIEAAADFSLLLRTLFRVHHFGVLAPLAIAGIWLTWPRRRVAGVLYLLLVAWTVAVAAFYVLARYRYPLVPVLALFAGAALVELLTAPRSRKVAAIAVALLAAVFVNWPLQDQDPRAPTYANLGNAMAEEGKVAEGAEMLQHAVALSPNVAETHLALGHLRLQLDDVDGAEASYRRTVELDPSQAAAWNNLGLVEARRGRVAESAEMFRRAIRANDRHTPALHNLARAELKAGRVAAAVELYQRVIALEEADAEAHHQLANLHAFGGDLASSRRHYERALQLEPTRADAHFKLAIVLDRLGDPAASTRHLARAIELTPGYADRFLRLAADAERAGQRAEAARLYAQLLAAAPGHPQATEALRRLGPR